MKRLYFYVFILILTIILFFRDYPLELINGIPINYNISDLLAYIPYIVCYFLMISKIYSNELKKTGYIYIIKYKSRSTWIKKLFFNLFITTLEYVLVINCIYLIFYYVDDGIPKYIYHVIIFFLGLFSLGILQVLIEYIYDEITALLLVIGYWSITTMYLHSYVRRGLELNLISNILPARFLESNLSLDNNLSLIYIAIIILIMYIVFQKYFKRKDII